MAGSKRPQREPTSVISLTITGAVSIFTGPRTVDFMITVPRGSHIAIAVRSPADDPVQSTMSLRRIKAIRDMQGATMWITHDPEDWKEYPHKVE